MTTTTGAASNATGPWTTTQGTIALTTGTIVVHGGSLYQVTSTPTVTSIPPTLSTSITNLVPLPDDWVMPDNWTGKIVLPDGSVIYADNGKVSIDDKDAKVVYKGCAVREFNRFINASDLLAEFVQFLGADARLSGPEALKIPVELFVSWLVVRAAESDGEDVEEGDRLRLTAGAHSLRAPRCKHCGRFIARRRAVHGVMFCSGEHQEQWLRRNT